MDLSKIVGMIKDEKLKKDLYVVKQVPLDIVKSICREKHYLHRVPSIVVSYGLYRKELLLGIITFGIPPSPQLMKICGGRK